MPAGMQRSGNWFFSSYISLGPSHSPHVSLCKLIAWHQKGHQRTGSQFQFIELCALDLTTCQNGTSSCLYKKTRAVSDFTAWHLSVVVVTL